MDFEKQENSGSREKRYINIGFVETLKRNSSRPWELQYIVLPPRPLRHPQIVR
jgi:hypothetical protein